MTVSIATSADGQTAVLRVGTRVTVLGDPATPSPTLELPTADVDLAVVGPPNGVVAVLRGPTPKVVLHALPELDIATTIELDAPMEIAAITGSRVALVTADRKRLVIVRVASRALAATALDPGGIAELAVGLERNQLLLGLPKKLEVWDAVAGRPLVRLQLQLPPPPRSVGAALGHVWATRPGSDEVFVYRLSDGRPFRHHAGSPVERAVCHPGSPVIVLVTAKGLVRLHCFAHSLTAIDAPWTPGSALALHGTGEDVVLLGLAPSGDAWKVGLDAPRPVETVPSAGLVLDLGLGSSATRVEPASTRPEPTVERGKLAPGWREPLAAAAAQVLAGHTAALPEIPDDSELLRLAKRFSLGEPARRALCWLYGLYLTGHTMSIADLARLLGDWTEPLAQGELARHELLRRRGGKVGLRPAVTAQLDGVITKR